MVTFLKNIFRVLVKKIASFFSPCCKKTYSSNRQDWLEETPYINYSHPTIMGLVKTLTQSGQTSQEKAIVIHNYVRDTILFGFEPEFYAMSASEVLKAKRGYCNTKSTLFIALLRAAKIPARQHFVSLSSHILDGITDPRTNYVDHSYVEVYINKSWIPVDSFIIDSKMFNNSKKLLSKPLGFGICKNAQLEWDGIHASFAQFEKALIKEDFGIFNDTDDFYKHSKKTYNKLGLLGSIMYILSLPAANNAIKKIRTMQVSAHEGK